MDISNGKVLYQELVLVRTYTVVHVKIHFKIPKEVIHVQASFNNTIVTVTDLRGRVISWSSADYFLNSEVSYKLGSTLINLIIGKIFIN